MRLVANHLVVGLSYEFYFRIIDPKINLTMMQPMITRWWRIVCIVRHATVVLCHRWLWFDWSRSATTTTTAMAIVARDGREGRVAAAGRLVV